MVTVSLPICNVPILSEGFFQDYCGHTFNIDDTVVVQRSAVLPQIRQLEV